MRTGTVSASASWAARWRLAPATISKLRSVKGRTSKGERTPWLRMLAANSLRAEPSKNRRGLVFDSMRKDSGRSRYSVLVFAIVIRCSLLGSGFRLVELGRSERTGLLRSEEHTSELQALRH